MKEFAEAKSEGQFLIAAGCLSEREKQQLASEVDGLDALLGTRRWAEIAAVVERLQQPRQSPYFYFPETDHILESDQKIVQAAVQGSSAYLKIADGCDPHLRVLRHSLNLKGPCAAARWRISAKTRSPLQAEGVKEIILIAQDTTTYGRDMGLTDGLPLLLRDLTRAVPDVPWIRFMYTYPGHDLG